MVLSVIAAADYFSKLTFFKTSFRKTTRVSHGLDTGQDRRSVRPDLDPNCLNGYQQLTKVVVSKERNKPFQMLWL